MMRTGKTLTLADASPKPPTARLLPTAATVPAKSPEPHRTRGSLTTAKWQQRFLKALRKSPSVRDACKFARISRATAYRHKARDPALAQLWTEAIEDAVDDLVAVAWKRAAEGDSNVLTFLLRAHRPSVYNPTNRTDIGLLGGIIIVPPKEDKAP
jgi:hypothetical protein